MLSLNVSVINLDLIKSGSACQNKLSLKIGQLIYQLVTECDHFYLQNQLFFNLFQKNAPKSAPKKMKKAARPLI